MLGVLCVSFGVIEGIADEEYIAYGSRKKPYEKRLVSLFGLLYGLSSLW